MHPQNHSATSQHPLYRNVVRHLLVHRRRRAGQGRQGRGLALAAGGARRHLPRGASRARRNASAAGAGFGRRGEGPRAPRSPPRGAQRGDRGRGDPSSCSGAGGGGLQGGRAARRARRQRPRARVCHSRPGCAPRAGGPPSRDGCTRALRVAKAPEGVYGHSQLARRGVGAGARRWAGRHQPDARWIHPSRSFGGLPVVCQSGDEAFAKAPLRACAWCRPAPSARRGRSGADKAAEKGARRKGVRSGEAAARAPPLTPNPIPQHTPNRPNGN